MAPYEKLQVDLNVIYIYIAIGKKKKKKDTWFFIHFYKIKWKTIFALFWVSVRGQKVKFYKIIETAKCKIWYVINEDIVLNKIPGQNWLITNWVVAKRDSWYLR